nr:MAG TPA: hypothetical protein [Caudoviricetes sp.]
MRVMFTIPGPPKGKARPQIERAYTTGDVPAMLPMLEG